MTVFGCPLRRELRLVQKKLSPILNGAILNEKKLSSPGEEILPPRLKGDWSYKTVPTVVSLHKTACVPQVLVAIIIKGNNFVTICLLPHNTHSFKKGGFS